MQPTEQDPAGARRALRWDALSIAMIAALTVLVIATSGDYGVTWDEWAHVAYGDRLYAWYRSGFEFTRSIDSPYGGGFDLLGALARRTLYPRDSYEAMHLVGGLVGVVGLVGAWRLGRLLHGAAGGALALGLLALTPTYYGHMFINPKDAPFAAAYVWALHYLCLVALRLPSVSWTVWLRLGLAAGAATSVRIGGLLALCYLGLALLAFAAWDGALTRSAEHVYRRLRGLVIGAAGATLVCWAVMMALWPWVLYHPLHRPFQALATMSQFTVHRRNVPFGDRVVATTDLPWDYLPRYLLLILPEMVVALAVAGAGLGLWRLAGRVRRGEQRNRTIALGLVAVAIAFPPLHAMVKGSALYDGMRHFLFVVPPIAVLAAGGAVALGRLAAARGPVAVAALAVVIAAGGARQLAAMIHLHPHEYVYYNALAGGLAGAEGRYETDYWGESYKEGLHRLRDRLWARERARYLGGEYVIKGCLPIDAESVLPANFDRMIDKQAPADFWVGHTRGDCHRRHPEAPVVVRVAREGSTLSVIRDLREPEPAADRGMAWQARYTLAGGGVVEQREVDAGEEGDGAPAVPVEVVAGRWETCVVGREKGRVVRHVVVEWRTGWEQETGNGLKETGNRKWAEGEWRVSVDGNEVEEVPEGELAWPGWPVDEAEPCWRYVTAKDVLP